MLKSLLHLLFSWSCIFVLISCSKTPEEKVRDALISAQLYLSNSECDKAIDLLEAVGKQGKNARYLITLATAYACRGGYSTTYFFANDIGKTGDALPLGGLSLYSTSTVTTNPLTEDSSFRDIQSAIDLLLYAGDIATTKNPTIVERAKYFSTLEAGDINALLAYLTMIQLGKLIKVYANTDSLGEKGKGSAGNTCLADYTGNALAIAFLANAAVEEATGLCVAPDSHSQLSSSINATTLRKRLCEGVVLLNGFLNVLPGVIQAAGGDELQEFSTIPQLIEDFKEELEGLDPTAAETLSVISQSKCETDTDITMDSIELYYAFLFESLIQ